MLKVAIAHSLELDTKDAIEEVLKQCSEQLDDLKPQAGLLFTGVDHDFEFILNRINEVYPEIELIGGTSGGEISSTYGFSDDSIVFTLFCSDNLEFKAGLVEQISKDIISEVQNAIEITKSEMKFEPIICLITPCLSYMVDKELKLNNIDHFLELFEKGFGASFPIFGGCTGNMKWQGDFQFYNFRVHSDSAPFLLISGPLLFSCGVESGWVPIGQKTAVSHADKNIVYKIGEHSALNYYKHYLGEIDFIGVMEYPLAIFQSYEEKYYLRGSTLFDTEEGSMTFTGDIPEGTTVQLTHATRDKIIEGAKMAVQSAISQYPGKRPSIALCFSCAARKIVLGTKVSEEYEMLKNDFPDLPVAGFYTGGEIGPLGNKKSAQLHNYSFACLLIGEE